MRARKSTNEPLLLRDDQVAFLRRRTAPLLKEIALHTLPHLLQGAYLQGMSDAVEVMLKQQPQQLPTVQLEP